MRSRQAMANDPGSVAEVIDVEFAPNAKSPTDAWASVVIGRNGVGKSRLLAGIADVFDRLSRGRLAVRRDALEVSRIEYLLDGQHCVIALDRDQRMITSRDGITCSPDELPMPAKVVALTTTPFDKFRVAANTDQRGIEHISRDDERYVYLGLRDRTGRASTTAAIFRALEGLFEASKSSDEKRNRIGDVFEFLG